MRKNFKLVILLTMIMSIFIVGCTNDKKTESPDGEKTVNIVTSGNAEPYSLVHADGNWTGIDAEIWEEIGKRTDWNIKMEKTTFDSIFGELDAGRADLAANCFATKAERNQKYYSSIPFG